MHYLDKIAFCEPSTQVSAWATPQKFCLPSLRNLWVSALIGLPQNSVVGPILYIIKYTVDMRSMRTVGRDGALVESIAFNRRVVGSIPALAVT